MNQEEKTRYWGGTIIFGLLFLVFFSISASTVYSTYKFKKDGKHTTGRIIYKWRVGADSYYKYRIVFRVDSIDSETLVQSSDEYHINDYVQLQYLPDDPDSVEFADELKMTVKRVVLLGGTVAVGIIFFVALIFPEWFVKYFTGDIW